MQMTLYDQKAITLVINQKKKKRLEKHLYRWKLRNMLINNSQVKEAIMEIRKYYNGMINIIYQNVWNSKWNVEGNFLLHTYSRNKE